MTKVFLGDIHGDFGALTEVCYKFPDKTVIQVGDFGLGFNRDPKPEELPWNVKWIRGNHDDLKICRNYPGWIVDGTVEDGPQGKVMYIGGAWSTDWQHRTPGRDWWSDEELNDYEWEGTQKIYDENKPAVMVTHDVPYQVRKIVIDKQFNGFGPTRTSHWLQEMFNSHAPKLWIHGHHHTNYVKTVGGCTFVGLGINSYVELDV